MITKRPITVHVQDCLEEKIIIEQSFHNSEFVGKIDLMLNRYDGLCLGTNAIMNDDLVVRFHKVYLYYEYRYINVSTKIIFCGLH